MSKADNIFQKEINELIDKRDELEKDYINYLEADMNKEASKTKTKIRKIEQQIRKIKDEEEFGLKEDMKKTIILYKKFINNKGLNNEFNIFKEKNEDKELNW